jgi:uncharacterized protein
MSVQKITQNTEAFVKSRLGNEGTGHDWHHADRVRNTGMSIQEREGGDPFVVELSLLLHDIGDRKVLNTQEDDPSIAEAFLRNQHIGRSTIDAVMYIISNMSFSKSLDDTQLNRTIELDIAQDSDRLDAIGAIGIARAFAFGGSRGRLLYDPDYIPQEFTSSSDYKNAGGSTLHHFDEKLFKLNDGLNTETAKKMAEDRDAYMHEFYDRFLAEWNGKK